MSVHQKERHRTEHLGWLRAAVLGAKDGIISTASLLVGIAAAHGTRDGIVIAGAAGLVAGAMSMAAGEYVSLRSQADTEDAALEVERQELQEDEDGEHKELTSIYVRRGLDPSLAKQVARQLMAHDALGAHARDELGISDTFSARPVQAAFSSAGAFSVGAAMPLLTAIWAPMSTLIPFVSGLSLVFLALLGGLAAYVGGATGCGGRSASPSGEHWPWRRPQLSEHCSERRPKILTLSPSRLTVTGSHRSYGSRDYRPCDLMIYGEPAGMLSF